MSKMNLWQQLGYYLSANGSYVMSQFWQHFLISAYGVLFACLVGIPIGMLIARRHKLSSIVIGAADVIQTVPSLALLSIIMLGLGLGAETVVVTVFLYSLLPVIKNTYAGMNSVDPGVLDSATGLGMTTFQRLWMVELPLSLGVIIAGIRQALVVAIGITATGAFIGAGGLGDIIIRGTNATNGGAIILAGALPTALMAVIADVLLNLLEKVVIRKYQGSEE